MNFILASLRLVNTALRLRQKESLEQNKMILMNKENRVLGIEDISTGGISGVSLDSKIMFSKYPKLNLAAYIKK